MDGGNYGKITRKIAQEVDSDDSSDSLSDSSTESEFVRQLLEELKQQKVNRTKMFDHLYNHFQTMDAKQKELQNRIEVVADEWRELNKIIAEDSISMRSVLSSTAEFDEHGDANQNDISENSESFVDSSPDRAGFDNGNFEFYQQNQKKN